MSDPSLSVSAYVDTEELRIALADAQAALADFEEAMERVNDAEIEVSVGGAEDERGRAQKMYAELKRQADREAPRYNTTD